MSRHKCLIYDGAPSEQLSVVVPLLTEGLRDRWRCLYLGSPEAVGMIDSALAAHGVDTKNEAERGALVLSSERTHLADGRFDPRAMVDSLCAATDEAVEDGFHGLCATGDMRWELGDDRNFEKLAEYEALLERAFRDRPLRGICQYHRAMIPPQAVRDALLTHGESLLGGTLDRGDLILRLVEAERARDDVLRDLERRVAERTAELEVANRHLAAFSYSVSHDLRAPLRTIRGFGEALAEECGDRLGDEGRKYLDRVLSGTRRMVELIEGMLSLGRVVNTELRRATVDLSALAHEVARELLERETRRPELVVEPGLRALGDPTLLRAVMSNLLGNALKFTSRRENARIQVGRRGEEKGKTVFFVRDNGVGFDMRHADKLFGVFQRLHRQDEFPGTGVGLATVERIVSRHGGRIWAEATLGAGAIFLFTLPAAPFAS
ncbi:MAG TPA: MEDS domain-containing protein [Polyangiaceae bacterium]